MINWTLRKNIRHDDPKFVNFRRDRRMDIVIALSFLDTKREVDRYEDGFAKEPQKMYLSGMGFVEKEEYINQIEFGEIV